MKHTLLFFIISLFSLGLSGQETPFPTKWNWNGDKIEIRYNLKKTGETRLYDVFFQIKVNGVIVDAPTLSGDIGQQKTGSKLALWNVYNDVVEKPQNVNIKYSVKPIEEDPDDYQNKTPYVLGSLGGLSGGGLLLAGFGLKKSNKVELYESTCIEGNSNYNQSKLIIGTGSTSSRSVCDDLYDDAKTDKTAANSINGTGIGLIAVGAGIIIYKAIDHNRKKKAFQRTKENDIGLHWSPNVQWAGASTPHSLPTLSYGVSITYTF